MNTFIALFRGINVGGKNLLPMKDLIAIFEYLGASDVRTYIQSGNAVFRISGKSTGKFGEQLAGEIEKRKRFRPQVIILSADDFKRAMDNNPFPEAEQDPGSLHLGFLVSTPKRPDLDKLRGLKKETERFQLVGSVFYLHAPEGVGRSKLAAASEKLIGVPMTDRNWRTVAKIRELTEKR